MRLTAALLLAAAALVLLLAWQAGAHEPLLRWAAERQREVQDALAARLLDLRSGSAAALWSLVGVCFAYGFLHAAGPGHGKLLVSSAAVATRATALRMALIAVAGSLAQAVVAIALAYGALALLAATARGTVDAAERWAALVGNAAIAAIGAWLVLRGLRGLRTHAHVHGPDCGHRHGPDPEAAAAATGPAAALALIGAMAARPCTGALFVLVIAWRMDLAASGVAAVLAMGLGTAAFTVIVALLAVAGRDAAFLAAGPGRTARLLGPSLQIAVGGLILGVGGSLALDALA